MNDGTTLNAPAAGGHSSASKRAFARHFAEMLLAMFAGMLVLGGLATALFSIFGSSLSDQSGALQVSLMGFNMTVPMVLWMRHRGHNNTRNAEMAGSMLVPSAIAAALAAAGTLGTSPALTVQHGVMIPAMLGVMLWRYQEYSHRLLKRPPTGAD